MATSETGCVCHLIRRSGCVQGRHCPLREMEAAIGTPLDAEVPFPAPKGKRMNYRPTSSAITGRAPRTMERAFGCSMNDPVHPMPELTRPGLRDFFAGIGQVIARLFGR